MSDEKPYQYIIDTLEKELTHFEKQGWDRERPGLYERIRSNLRTAKRLQREEETKCSRP